MLFSPHHGDSEHARLVSILRTMHKVEAQSSILQVLYHAQVL